MGGYRVHPSVLFTDLEDGTGVLLHLDSKYYYTLNESGTVIWRALVEHEGEDVQSIALRLATSVFGVEQDVLTTDLENMVREMVSEDILLEEQA